MYIFFNVHVNWQSLSLSSSIISGMFIRERELLALVYLLFIPVRTHMTRKCAGEMSPFHAPEKVEEVLLSLLSLTPLTASGSKSARTDYTHSSTVASGMHLFSLLMNFQYS
jgi:hypothetical protein